MPCLWDPSTEDLFPVAFTERESDADKNRRDSWVTKVPEEGDDLEEFEESDECQWFDDGVGGVAQASTQHLLLTTDSKNDSEAQERLLMTDSEENLEVATPQMFDISSDLDGESEAAKPQMFDINSDLDGESEEPVLPEMPFAPPEGDYGDDSETTEHLEQFRHEQGRDTLVSTSGSSGSSYQEPVLPEMPFAPPEGDYGDDSETTEHLEQFRHEQGRDTLVSASGSNGSSYQVRKPCVWIHGIPFEAKTEDFDTGWEYLYDGLVCPEAETITKVQEARHDARLAEDTLCPQIFLHLLGFLPVTEVLEYNLQAVSRNFSSREVWMTHLFNLMDFDSFQPVIGIPTAPVWHPIEELSAYFSFVASQDESLSITEKLVSPPVAQFRAEASEGFQGCYHALFGPWAKKLQGKYLAHVDLVVRKGDARFLGDG
ncbi:unnamed protein product [Cladocopium goreaui]|uniref:Uncharacterized protein n=1 Tax=Cladocopium goreaui TaxID=2562237 RepID=A0A9P1BSW7_9DINO|nr:unnamed protein product [Cladocopium goreaui]